MEHQVIKIGSRSVGEGQPVFVIAEAGINHNGSLELALQLVDVAAAAQADAVKFQKRNLEKLYPQALLEDPNSAEWAFQYMLPILKQTQLSDDDFRQIKAHCDKKGILFMCTPWDEDSLAFLEEVGQPAYKVSSADLINLPLIEKLIDTGKPLILSTGMATVDEIETTVQFLRKHQAAFVLLHCVSTYPAPFESLNLRFIETLKQFGAPIGYSGHERGIAIPLLTVAMGACLIEKHITTDRTLPGPDHPASLELGGISKLIRDIRNAEMAMGSNIKELSTMESLNRQVLRKSLVAARDLPAGTIITRDMVGVNGPGKGLSPQRFEELIGTKLDRAIARDDYFVASDLVSHTVDVIQRQNLHRPWGLKARFHDLAEILEKKPELVELHFSDVDVEHPFEPPQTPHKQQLFIHAPEFFDGSLLDLSSYDERLREQSVALLQRTVDKALELQPHFAGGIGGIVIHVGGMSMDEPEVNRRQLLYRALDAFKQIDGKGIPLMPENLPPRPWYLGGQWFQNIFIEPEEMIEFCRELNTGMTLDLSHAQLYCNSANRTLQEFIDLCLPYTRHLHIADATGIDGEGVQIGEGVVQWDSVLGLLKRKDFTWVPEIWSGHLENGAGFVEAINRLGKFGVL